MSNVIVKLSVPADSPRPLHYVHQDQVIDLAPGEFRWLDFDIAVAMFGHPGEQDTPTRRGRTDNYNRIKFQWGYQLGMLGAEEDWEAKRPHFRVETQNGEHIPMLLEDPLGNLPLPTEVGGSGGQLLLPPDPNVEALQAVIAQQQAQLDQFQGILNSLLQNQVASAALAATGPTAANSSDLPPVTDDGATVDAPAVVPTSIPADSAAPPVADEIPTEIATKGTRLSRG